MHSQLAANLLNAAIHHDVDIQFASGRERIRLALGITRNGLCGADKQFTAGAEVIDHGVGESHAQVLVAGIRREEFEGEHGYGTLSSERGGKKGSEFEITRHAGKFTLQISRTLVSMGGDF